MNNQVEPLRTAWGTLAVIIVWLEALLLVGAAVFAVVLITTGETADPTAAVAIGAFALALGVGVAASGVGLWRERRWARAPVITWQVLQAAVGLALLEQQSAIGIALIAAAGVVALPVLRTARARGEQEF